MSNDVVAIVVEIPKGSRSKYEMDHDTGEMFLDRMLFISVQYPAEVYEDLEGHTVSTEGFEDRSAAGRAIDEARDRSTQRG